MFTSSYCLGFDYPLTTCLRSNRYDRFHCHLDEQCARMSQQCPNYVLGGPFKLCSVVEVRTV